MEELVAILLFQLRHAGFCGSDRNPTGDAHRGAVGALGKGVLGSQGDAVACGRFKVQDIRDLALNSHYYLKGLSFSVFLYNQGVITCARDRSPLHMHGHAFYMQHLDFRYRQHI